MKRGRSSRPSFVRNRLRCECERVGRSDGAPNSFARRRRPPYPSEGVMELGIQTPKDLGDSDTQRNPDTHRFTDSRESRHPPIPGESRHPPIPGIQSNPGTHRFPEQSRHPPGIQTPTDSPIPPPIPREIQRFTDMSTGESPAQRFSDLSGAPRPCLRTPPRCRQRLELRS